MNWESAAVSKDEKNHRSQFVYEIKTNTYGKSSTSIAQFLYVLENQFGLILDVNLIELTISDSNYNNTQLALNLINNILGNYSGTITKKKITGLSLYEVDILDGLVSSYSCTNRRSSNQSESKSNALKECVDYYWQTYVNGVLVNEVYLFTDCSQGVEEGAGGSSNSILNSPCTEVDSLATNIVFNSKIDSLRLGWNNAYETGYNYKLNSYGGLSFNQFQGLPGSGVFVPATGSVMGIMHNHNTTEPFSIFSSDDLRQMYQVFFNNQADSGFAFTLVTGSSSYILKVSNLQQFLAFGQTYLQDPLSFFAFSAVTTWQYSMSETQSVEVNENGFLRMIQSLNCGLELFSLDTSSSTWHLKGVDPNNIYNTVIVNCL